jgi:hypothetical protein
MSTRRIRYRDPWTGQVFNRDIVLGPANGMTRGAASSAQSAPVSSVGHMMPIIKGRLLDSKHLGRGKEASRAFRIK